MTKLQISRHTASNFGSFLYQEQKTSLLTIILLIFAETITFEKHEKNLLHRSYHTGQDCYS